MCADINDNYKYMRFTDENTINGWLNLSQNIFKSHNWNASLAKKPITTVVIKNQEKKVIKKK